MYQGSRRWPWWSSMERDITRVCMSCCCCCLWCCIRMLLISYGMMCCELSGKCNSGCLCIVAVRCYYVLMRYMCMCFIDIMIWWNAICMHLVVVASCRWRCISVCMSCGMTCPDGVLSSIRIPWRDRCCWCGHEIGIVRDHETGVVGVIMK